MMDSGSEGDVGRQGGGAGGDSGSRADSKLPLHRGSVVRLLERRLTAPRPRVFESRISSLHSWVRRLEVAHIFPDGTRDGPGHLGCVNTVAWMGDGVHLISAGDDTDLIVWHAGKRTSVARCGSFHVANIFSALHLPGRLDHVVTCGADGGVCLVVLPRMATADGYSAKVPSSPHLREFEVGDGAVLGRHNGRAHRLALLPDSLECFLSTGDDGAVKLFDMRASQPLGQNNKIITVRNRAARGRPAVPLSVNTLECSPLQPHLLAVGGNDRYLRLYDRRALDRGPINWFSPSHVRNAHITGLKWAKQGDQVVASFNDDDAFLFDVMHTLDAVSGETATGLTSDAAVPDDWDGETSLEDMSFVSRYCGHRNRDTVKGVSFFGPNDEYVVSGCDTGHLFVYDRSSGDVVQYGLGDRIGAINSLAPHPLGLPLLATSGLEMTVRLWEPSPTKTDTFKPDEAEEASRAVARARYVAPQDVPIEHLHDLIFRHLGASGAPPDPSVLEPIMTAIQRGERMVYDSSDGMFNEDDDEDAPDARFYRDRYPYVDSYAHSDDEGGAVGWRGGSEDSDGDSDDGRQAAVGTASAAGAAPTADRRDQ